MTLSEKSISVARLAAVQASMMIVMKITVSSRPADFKTIPVKKSAVRKRKRRESEERSRKRRQKNRKTMM